MDTTVLPRRLLLALYEVYHEITREFAFACTRECSVCCTHNVLATSLEVDLIVDHLEENGRQDLVQRMLEDSAGTRMRPALTINSLAAYCLRREDPPEPIHEYSMGPCPVREPDGCPIYPVRPFACRSMWSTELCSSHGEALPHPLLLTISGVFEQILEHIDKGGLCGNMIDLFALLTKKRAKSSYRAGATMDATEHLLATVRNPGLLVPLEHRGQVMAILHRLETKDVSGISFRDAMETLLCRKHDPMGSHGSACI